MADRFQETEVKLYVPELAPVAARLAELGAPVTAPRVFERNVRYDTPDRALSKGGRVLRLRQDTRVRLTYKMADGSGAANQYAHTRYEAETEVGDFEVMDAILRQLGYMPYMNYEKYRTTYHLEGVEVVLDEMPYGNFVEIEGDDAGIGRALEALHLQDAPRIPANYAAIFERVKAALGLTFNDLTFANFEGISVPASAIKGG